jgi:hypothetical protein
MSFEIKGLQEFQKKLHDLSERAKKLDGQHFVSLSELFNESFLLKYTNFKSIADMFEKGGFKVENQDDLKAIPDDKWDAFIRSNTQFQNWKEMQQKAVLEWGKKKLGF